MEIGARIWPNDTAEDIDNYVVKGWAHGWESLGPPVSSPLASGPSPRLKRTPTTPASTPKQVSSSPPMLDVDGNTCQFHIRLYIYTYIYIHISHPNMGGGAGSTPRDGAEDVVALLRPDAASHLHARDRWYSGGLAGMRQGSLWSWRSEHESGPATLRKTATIMLPRVGHTAGNLWGLVSFGERPLPLPPWGWVGWLFGRGRRRWRRLRAPAKGEQ